MEWAYVWEEHGEPDPDADQRFREIEAAGENTPALLGLSSWADLYVHVAALQTKVAGELPYDIELDRQVQDAGHFAVLGYLIDYGTFRAYAFGAKFSLYGKLATVWVDDDWLIQESSAGERLSHVERFAALIAEAGYELVPASDLGLPYSGPTFGPQGIAQVQPTWHYFFFEYW